MTTPAIKPVLFVLTSHGAKGDTGQPTGYFLGEVTHPFAVLQGAGIPVEFASIAGGEPPVDGLDLADPVNAKYWNDPAFRSALSSTRRLDDIDPANYSAIFFAGGHGTMWDFPQSAAAQRAIRDIYEHGGVVAAVCHGPSALVNATLSDGSPLVAGKRVAAFTDAEEHAVGLEHVVPFLLSKTLAERGAILQDAPTFSANSVADGRLVTGQNPQSATGVGEKLRDLLQAKTP
ncbi:type 1 glutamine amidotransferase domain-containing protein [Solilutibacter silvestris]|uniref:Putative intracellular protease/amidase n=1 Tax=Solilutibacter silvestris TaxID=1645665 RepID=A0A2K1Q300_9GAMM|nr:type 1 glutamine amidotransferase domain-containing protein [Lysobacter silvestris]PNS09422.1 putative intracellular protease/amidase [Lysobacter silvestris]